MAKAGKKQHRVTLRDAILMISPGTKIREAIAAILQGHNGALLCIGDPKRLGELSEGGFELATPCTPQVLYELAKMDGAIILNRNASQVVYANRFLKPDNSISSHETGMRHRSAERLARQTQCVVIALSERRSSVTLYVGDEKHVLDSIPTLLNKATQAIQTLEKYIIVLNDSMQELTAREFQDTVTIVDACKAVQRYEMVTRIAQEIEPYLLELGTEGRLIELQLKELTIPVEEAELVIKDYYKAKAGVTFEHVRKKVTDLSRQDLPHLSNISQALGYSANIRSVDTYLSPRGYRVLTLTHRLSPQVIENLVKRFGTLQAIIRAPKDELVEVDGVGEVMSERLRNSLNVLRNQPTIDRSTP